MYADILIIGGGASGLAAACTASGCGLSVALLEKNPRVGKKLLMTGNGRCNLGNRNIEREFFHGDYDSFSDIIINFDIHNFFAATGLYCAADSMGRLYPRSNSASSVLDALRFSAEGRGVKTLCNCRAENILPTKHGFDISTNNGTFSCRRLILAAGGCAAPATGSDGFSYDLARKLGHEIINPSPALTRIKTDSTLIRPLKGQRAAGAVKLLQGGEILRCQEGEIQFSDGMLSGICVFNLSRQPGICAEGLEISLDLLPDFSLDRLSAMLSDILHIRGKMASEDMLSGIIPKKIGALLTGAVRPGKSAAAVLAAKIKDMRFPVLGTGGWRDAQATAGGVPAAELFPDLRSRRCKNMYFIGEAVNIDGDCGGYNLHWAWSSGCAGALSAVKSLKE